MASVKKRSADRKISLGGDTHNKECLPTKQNILHRIENMWKHQDVDGVKVIAKGINDDESKEQNVTNS